MTRDPLSDAEDGFQTGFFQFVKALETLTQPAQMQCEIMGNYNTPYEIVLEVSAGEYMPNSASIGLSKDQAEGIFALAAALKALPDEAISPQGANMTSHAGCMKGMQHPAWEPLRRQASRLLVILQPAIARNREHLYPD